MHKSYPMGSHPCWSNDHSEVWERIHLPVAPRCNVKCVYCDHRGGTSCHIPLPGGASRVFSVQEALEKLKVELDNRPKLKIVAVSGPGEPLYNPQTFEVFERVAKIEHDLEFCLSTNGILLEESVDRLATIGVRTVTVTVNAVRTETAESAYEWIKIGRQRLFSGFGEIVVRRQIDGIRAATDAGIHVKVNTVLMPDINVTEVETIAREIAMAGAEFHNITPVIPCSSLARSRPPTHEEIITARALAAKYLPQFYECKQCRSDVVGIPGYDVIL